jgi:hypothetical protein
MPPTAGDSAADHSARSFAKPLMQPVTASTGRGSAATQTKPRDPETRRGVANQLSAGAAVVRHHGSARAPSNGAQVVRRRLARLAIGNNIERDLLSLVEAAHPGTFDGTDMDEHILAAVIGLNEAVAWRKLNCRFQAVLRQD